MNEIILYLISGLAGALIGSILTIGFTIWKDNNLKKMSLAREKLEKVYGPLVALKKKIDLVNQSKGGFLLPKNKEESEMIEKIIFNCYHLIDDDLKEGIVLLHPELSKHSLNQFKQVQLKVLDKIIEHYKENKQILGLK